MTSISFDGVLPCAMRASEAAVSTVADVVSRLGADCSAGLTQVEVERRRKVFGRNEFVIKKEEPLWRKYLNQVGKEFIVEECASDTRPIGNGCVCFYWFSSTAVTGPNVMVCLLLTP